jgi:hypothetical protein
MTMAILVCLLGSGETAMNVVMHAWDGEGQDKKNFIFFIFFVDSLYECTILYLYTCKIQL